MENVICEIILSLFFVYGVYSAINQIRLLVRRLLKRHRKIDKQASR